MRTDRQHSWRSDRQAELQTLELAHRLHFVDRDRVAPVMDAGSEVAKMLHRLVASLESAKP